LLFVSTVPFGESLALLAALGAIRNGFKNAFITAAASSGAVELFSAYRLADETIDLGLMEKSGDGAAVSSLVRTIKLLRTVRRRRFDLIVDCAPRVGTQLLALFSRGKTVVPIVRLPDLVDDLLGGKHGRRTRIEAASASIIRQLELTPLPDAARFQPGPEVSARIEESLRKQGFRGGAPLILLYSNDPGSPKAWPPARFIEVGSRLAANYGVRVVILDRPYESKLTNAIAAAMPRETIKLRAPRALEVIGALARASLVVTDDAGVARFSSRLGTATIDIGSTSQKSSDGIPGLRAGRPAGKRPAGVKGGLLASGEDVYQVACTMLQASRTAVLFEN
ncbi:MAG TPA: hypothetical protein VEZ90_13095, partial [Blastocatellia bacterium]|nr:hypothetical protein [Blastocatellia bacterium]